MSYIGLIFETILKAFTESGVALVTIITVLIMAVLLSLYLCFVYRNVSHRAFYNRTFNLCVTVMPALIATIILCLQSNIVITLGTIGALAIIRFRTAIKDPVDMLYLLWAVHIGITCGTQLYPVAVLTSAAVTILLLVFTNVQIGKKPYVAVIHAKDPAAEKEITDAIASLTKSWRVKSRTFTPVDVNYVIELSVKDPAALAQKLRELNLEKYSVIEYDSEDIV